MCACVCACTGVCECSPVGSRPAVQAFQKQGKAACLIKPALGSLNLYCLKVSPNSPDLRGYQNNWGTVFTTWSHPATSSRKIPPAGRPVGCAPSTRDQRWPEQHRVASGRERRPAGCCQG